MTKQTKPQQPPSHLTGMDRVDWLRRHRELTTDQCLDLLRDRSPRQGPKGSSRLQWLGVH